MICDEDWGECHWFSLRDPDMCDSYLLPNVHKAYIFDPFFDRGCLLEEYQTIRIYLPRQGQMGFSSPATNVMEKIIDLHHYIFFFLVVIAIIVTISLIFIMELFGEHNLDEFNHRLPRNLSNHTYLELI